MLRDAIAMGLTTVPIVVVLVLGAILQNWRRRLRGQSGDVRPTGGYGRTPMPFTKTEVDIHEDYTLEAVDPAWLAQGVKSPKHLMLDPDNCILCRACEDVCPGTASTCWRRRSCSAPRRRPPAPRWGTRRRSSWWTTTPARGAPCASTDARRTPCTMRGCRRGRRPADDGRGPDVPGGGGTIVSAARGERVEAEAPRPSEVGDRLRETEVWKSIFRPGSIFRKGYKDTSRDRALATMNNVLYHLHPVKVKRHGLKLTYTFCLGGFRSSCSSCSR